MNIEQARSLSLESFIKQLGYQEVAKGKSNEAWFKSPLRNEKTPSFKVDRTTNKWIDFASDAKQYDIIDFVKAYGERSGWGSLNTSQALQRIAQVTGELPRQTTRQTRASLIQVTPEVKRRPSDEPATFRIDHIGPLRNKNLVDYLRDRKLLVGPAKNYLQEIYYTYMQTKRQYYGLTWTNEQGGQEIRSPHFKTIIGNKAPSIFEVQHPKTIPGTAVFEGMTDYLSYLQIAKREVMARAIVMNSTATYQRVIELVKELPANEPVKAFLQNDKAGLETAIKLKQALPHLQIQNHAYSAYGDLNDYLAGKPLAMEDKKFAQQVLGRELKQGGPAGTLKIKMGKSAT